MSLISTLLRDNKPPEELLSVPHHQQDKSAVKEYHVSFTSIKSSRSPSGSSFSHSFLCISTHVWQMNHKNANCKNFSHLIFRFLTIFPAAKSEGKNLENMYCTRNDLP
jgi:hypothetical protein